MAAFEYKALDGKGKQKKGVVEGDNSRQVRQRLKEQGLVPISIKVTETKTKNNDRKASTTLTFKRGISTNDLSLITRQLSTLVQSGIPLEECLKAVAEQSEKSRITNMLMGIRSRVVEGYTLAESFTDYPHIFDELFCSMVAAGEKSGHLDNVLDRLADYAENRQRMRSKLQQAMIYPIVLSTFAVGIIAFLLASVVPKIVDQFVQMGQELPTSTQFLLSMSAFVLNWGFHFLFGFMGLYALISFALRKPNIRLFWDKKVLRFPLIGKIAKGINAARFARTLSICTSSAIPLLDGMKVAMDVMSNYYIKQKVQEASEKVREGSTLRLSLDQTELFPPMMLHMIASGEQGGDLEQMLIRAADNQDKDFESTVNITLGLFSPALIAVMAGVVLFIVMATLMPILEMNSLISA